MKTKILQILILIIGFLSFSCSKAEKSPEKAKWKGKIEYEKGVKVVKNPAEPLYGKIILDIEEDLSIGSDVDDNYIFYRVSDIATDHQGNIYVLDSGNFRIQKFDFNGQYLQTIGKKGQGPGEFENPYRILFDNQNNIYVTDKGGRLIKIFNSQGEFVKTIHLESSISEFYVDSDKNIFASAALSTEKGTKRAFVKMNSEGKITKIIDEFSDVKAVTKKSSEMEVTFRAIHNYTPRLSFSPLNDRTFSYAYSTKYQVFVVDNTGKPLMKIQKEEVAPPISQSEKKFVIEQLERSISRGGRKWPEGVVEEACNFPPSRPFFRRIIVDDRERLFIWRINSVLDKTREREFDVFNKEGYFLYQAKFPVLPEIINKGFLYNIKEDRETGEVFIRRFRIKNWDQVKEGI